MPDPQRLIATLRRAVDAFRTTPGRAGRLVRVPAGDELFVVGDLHGHVENFRSALLRADLATHPRRRLVVQEIVHGPFAYPDAGDKSHQMLDLVAALKCQYPARVHYLLGNHEMAQWKRQRIGKGDVDQNVWFEQGVRTAYGDAADAVIAEYDRLFAAADLAIRTENRVFVSHTLPPASSLERFSLDLLEQPTLPDDVWRSGGPVHGLLWGRDLRDATAAAFLARVDADWLITGHIRTEDGFQAPNERQLILDALGHPACACLVPTDRPVTLADLVGAVVAL